MNFTMVESVAGQNDSDGYQVKVKLNCIVGTMGEAEFSKKGSKFQQVTLTDSSGRTEKVKIWLGNGPDIVLGQMGQTLTFDIGPNPYKGKMYYAGFWDSNAAQVPQQAQQQPQQAAPRTPQQATQQANQSIQQAAQGAKSNKPDWDAISRGKVRHGIVCAYIKSGKEPNIQDVELWVDYVMTGQKAGFDQFAAENPVEQDNNPFE